MVPLHPSLYVTRMADEEWKNGSRTLRCATFPPDFLPQIRGKRGGPQILVGTHSAVIAASRDSGAAHLLGCQVRGAGSSRRHHDVDMANTSLFARDLPGRGPISILRHRCCRFNPGAIQPRSWRSAAFPACRSVVRSRVSLWRLLSGPVDGEGRSRVVLEAGRTFLPNWC
jgi:hypothetical protein